MNPTTATVNTEVLNPSTIPLQNRPMQNKNTFGLGRPLGRRASARAAGFDRADYNVHDEKGVLLAEVRGTRRSTRRLSPVPHPLVEGKTYGLTYAEALAGHRQATQRAQALVAEGERRRAASLAAQAGKA